MHFLITRPKPQADPLRILLQKLGHRVMLAPLLEITLEKPHIVLDGLQSIIATSQNAIRALIAHPNFKDIVKVPIIVVGSGTAAEAVKAGFQILAQGEAGAADLAEKLKVLINPRLGPLLHTSGDILAFDLQGALSPLGILVQRTIVYRTITEKKLPHQVKEALLEESLDGILLMSPRTSQVWVNLVRSAGLEEKAEKILHYCLSDAVAQPLNQNPKIATKIALRPDIKELITLIENNTSSVFH